jgi:hypothetical protein
MVTSSDVAIAQLIRDILILHGSVVDVDPACDEILARLGGGPGAILELELATRLPAEGWPTSAAST